MRDPIEELRDMDASGAATPPRLSAAEVRRLGDRRRRRTHALLAVGSAAAVAAVAIPLSTVSIGVDRDVPVPPATRTSEPTESPTATQAVEEWPGRLPDSFPLASGFPESDDGDVVFDPPSREHRSMVGTGLLTACGTSVSAADPPVDRMATSISVGSAGETREIQLFADDRRAAAHLAAIADVYSACPSEGEAPTITTTVTPGAVGDESWLVKRASDGIGPGVVYAVRVGNAVFVDHAGNEGDGGAVDALATEVRENFADVVAAMHTLMEGSGAEPSGDATAEPGAGIDEGNLLTAAEIPELIDTDGAWEQVPNSDEPTLVCQGSWLSELGAVDSEYGEYQVPDPDSEVPAGLLRLAVLDFADAAEARTAYDVVASWIDECPRTQSDRNPDLGSDPTHPEVGADEAVLRLVQYAAPEICVECDSGWADNHAAAVRGDRLLVMSLVEQAGNCTPGGCDGAAGANVARQWQLRVHETVRRALHSAVTGEHLAGDRARTLADLPTAPGVPDGFLDDPGTTQSLAFNFDGESDGEDLAQLIRGRIVLDVGEVELSHDLGGVNEPVLIDRVIQGYRSAVAVRSSDSAAGSTYERLAIYFLDDAGELVEAEVNRAGVEHVTTAGGIGARHDNRTGVTEYASWIDEDGSLWTREAVDRGREYDGWVDPDGEPLVLQRLAFYSWYFDADGHGISPTRTGVGCVVPGTDEVYGCPTG